MAFPFDKQKDTLILICKELNISRFYIFGSALTDSFNNESDIDVLISFQGNISKEEYVENYFTLHDKLQTLFQRNVDIITERTLSNPYFIESINKNKVLIYET